jgi:hypothetical protein
MQIVFLFILQKSAEQLIPHRAAPPIFPPDDVRKAGIIFAKDGKLLFNRREK